MRNEDSKNWATKINILPVRTCPNRQNNLPPKNKTRGPRAWRSADRKQTRNRIQKYVHVFLILHHSCFVVEYHNFQNLAW
jgi:hypothetical protein